MEATLCWRCRAFGSADRECEYVQSWASGACADLVVALGLAAFLLAAAALLAARRGSFEACHKRLRVFVVRFFGANWQLLGAKMSAGPSFLRHTILPYRDRSRTV
uniref:Uncharacterized protein n=1 Tax=Zooxanthella nutricula TaxID=1333877 RepID=A0A7S2HUA8_9DINO